MKKLVAFMLCGAMAFSSSIAVFANNNSNHTINQTIKEFIDEDLDESKKEEINSDVNYLNSIGFGQNFLKAIEVKDDSVIYTILPDNGLESTIEIKHEENGDMAIHVEENGLANDLILTIDGRIFLDGVEFEPNSIEIEGEFGNHNMARSVRTNSMSPQRGKASDYTDYQTTLKYHSIELEKRISKISRTALAMAIEAVICVSGAGFVADISYGIAETLIDQFYSTDTYGLSCISKVYEHKDGPQFATVYEKYVTTWYSEEDYKGDSTTITSYSMTEYN